MRTHTKKAKRVKKKKKKIEKTEGGNEAYCILNSYLHSISQKTKLD